MLKYSQASIKEYIINLSYKQESLVFNIKIRFISAFITDFLHIRINKANVFILAYRSTKYHFFYFRQESHINRQH
jgi:hypothetical protein